MKNRISPALIFDTVKISLFRKVYVKMLNLGEIEQFIALYQLYQFAKVTKAEMIKKEASQNLVELILKKAIKYYTDKDLEMILKSAQKLNFSVKKDDKKKVKSKNEKKNKMSLTAYYIAYFATSCGWSAEQVKALYPTELEEIIKEIQIKKTYDSYKAKVDTYIATRDYTKPDKVLNNWSNALEKEVNNIRSNKVVVSESNAEKRKRTRALEEKYLGKGKK